MVVMVASDDCACGVAFVSPFLFWGHVIAELRLDSWGDGDGVYYPEVFLHSLLQWRMIVLSVVGESLPRTGCSLTAFFVFLSLLVTLKPSVTIFRASATSGVQ